MHEQDLDPLTREALIEALRTLVFRMPAGMQITGHRDHGASAGEITVRWPSGETTTYDGGKHGHAS